MMFQKLDKKSLIYLIIVVAAFLLACGLIYYFSRTPGIKEQKIPQLTGKDYEKIIRELTAPEEVTTESLPEEVVKGVTAPQKAETLPLPGEVIKNLTSP